MCINGTCTFVYTFVCTFPRIKMEFFLMLNKKGLKILTGYSEAINRRKYTMTNRKRTKEQLSTKHHYDAYPLKGARLL